MAQSDEAAQGNADALAAHVSAVADLLGGTRA